MNTQRDEREERMKTAFPIGAVVRVKDPDGYISTVASKIRNRLGEVTGHQMPTPNPLVTFFAIGRRKEHRMVFNYSPERDIEVITDETLIAAWRSEVVLTKARQEAARKKIA